MGDHRPAIAYCTNLLAGDSWAEMRRNVTRCAAAVREALADDAPLGLGLWMSANTAREIVAQGASAQLRQWLDEHRLCCVTLNGFPHGDFHGAVVKHAVYTPAWDDVRRRDYTLDLVRIFAELLPAGNHGSISTLPIGWGARDLSRAAALLTDVAAELAAVARRAGRHITLDLEPEPGCVLQTSTDIVSFFESHLMEHRAHLGVCHDVCHAAVMFEDQATVVRRYHDAGLRVGKVQVSAALAVDFDRVAPAGRSQVRDQLAAFAEPRYLHQTVVRQAEGATTFYEDLDAALGHADAGAWRVHFHVPIDLRDIGALGTTASQIPDALNALRALGDLPILEIETYAWPVLPAEYRVADVADGMIRELRWLQAWLDGSGGR